ncbi:MULTISPECIES: carbohydrate ABC transporter permease [unclassified Mycoplasma]|uniref:carbohydrate ABC transporter permease n=1 Tax=unclassified Mycoplasma TaxID=2683645 RepID=UPI00211C6D98|nr:MULTISPECIES: carbohydrate ABC transporter permease [unclassified Mycoplasma]UUM20012.1 carbohydrate ABC transporter permease [Mycoplasma sp. 1578d]UUM24993.1 carbohydrate ABC transporter permease [Mycoplasma sp. 3686d]
MFELKLRAKQHFISKKLNKNQERVSSQVREKNLYAVILSSFLKLLVLTFFGVLIIFPFVFMILVSFMNDREANSLDITFTLIPSFSKGIGYVPKEGLTNFDHWADIAKNTYSRALTTGYWSAFILTSANVLVSVFLKVFITSLMGYAFSIRNWKGKGILWFISLALLVLPEVALLSGQYIVILKTGLFKNFFLFVIGVAAPFAASIFNTVMYKNAFEAIPGRIKEVSLIDGSSGAKYFFKIALPMVLPTTITIIILTSLVSWNAYLWPLVISNIGSNGYEVISVWLFKAGLDPEDPDSGANIAINVKLAASIMVILPMFVVYLFARKWIMRAVSRQGSTIKG